MATLFTSLVFCLTRFQEARAIINILMQLSSSIFFVHFDERNTELFHFAASPYFHRLLKIEHS